MSGWTVNRSERLMTIERLLFRNVEGLSAVDLARACGVDRRTIYRDLTTLEQLGVPISHDDARFYIHREYYLASVRLNLHEAVALFIAARFLSRNVDQQNPHIISALDKLSHALPEPIASHAGMIADRVRGNPIDRNFVQILEMVTQAWVERRRIRVWASLVRNGELQTIDIAVYFMEPSTSGGIYVIGQDAGSEATIAVRLEWIKRAKLLEDRYQIPENFDRHPYLESVWGITSGEQVPRTRIVLAFAPDVTSLIRERLWHSSQRIETLDDKRCTLTVHVGDWQEMLPWIRSWGSRVEVLEPDLVRQHLLDEAAATVKTYGGASGETIEWQRFMR